MKKPWVATSGQAYLRAAGEGLVGGVRRGAEQTEQRLSGYQQVRDFNSAYYLSPSAGLKREHRFYISVYSAWPASVYSSRGRRRDKAS